MVDNLVLDYVETKIFESIKTSGDSKPLGVICTKLVDGSEIPCVLKLREAMPYKHHSCAREAIGSMIACLWGIRVPQPFVVHVSEEFAHSISIPEVEARCLASLGDNFGSRTIEKDFLPFDNLTKEKFQDGLTIFAFDALIQNSDRTKIKDNLYQDPGGLIIIDHEKAFMFSKPAGILGGFPEPYNLVDPRFNYLREHLIFKFIRREPTLNFENIKEKVDVLTEPIVDRIIDSLPKSWQSEETGIIRDHLINVSANSDQFVKNLKELLA